MPLKTNGPVTFNEEQILALHQKLQDMLVNITNDQAVIRGCAELVLVHPEQMAKRLNLRLEHTDKPTEAGKQFWREFESAFGLTRQ